MAKTKLGRIFHRYEKLEEYHSGMWRIVHGSKRQQYIDATADLMRCSEEFKAAMMQAIDTWKVSCEANLTAHSINKLAWLGHAGSCIATNSPEDCTRLGWHELTKPEQDEANRVAQEVLDEWRRRQDVSDVADLFGGE